MEVSRQYLDRVSSTRSGESVALLATEGFIRNGALDESRRERRQKIRFAEMLIIAQTQFVLQLLTGVLRIHRSQ